MGPLARRYAANSNIARINEHYIARIIEGKQNLMTEATSLIRVNFEDTEVTVFTKDSKLTKEFFIGNIGGIFGVFIGFSVVGFLDHIINLTAWVTRKINFFKALWAKIRTTRAQTSSLLPN